MSICIWIYYCYLSNSSILILIKILLLAFSHALTPTNP